MVHYKTFKPEQYYIIKERLKKEKAEIKTLEIIKKENEKQLNNRSTPWISGTEWKTVYWQLFDPRSSPLAWREAYTTMLRWSRMTGVKVPTAVVATIPLLKAKNIWRSYHARPSNTASPEWLQECFTTPREQAVLYTNLAIVQFVNAFVKEEEHRHDVRGNTVSMKELGSLAGLPDYCIAIRNSFVHSTAVGALDDEHGFRMTVVDRLWMWIKTQYWDVEMEALHVSERLYDLLQGLIVPPVNLNFDIKHLLNPSPDHDRRESLFLAIDSALRREAESDEGLLKCRKKRVWTVVEELVHQLLLSRDILKQISPQQRKITRTNADYCSCGCCYEVDRMKPLLNMMCWLLTHTLGAAIQRPKSRPSSTTPDDRSPLKQRTDDIIAQVFAAQDVADAGYTVADHVFSVLVDQATGPKQSFPAKQWLQVLAVNCCPGATNDDISGFDQGCRHNEMFIKKSHDNTKPDKVTEELTNSDPLSVTSSEEPTKPIIDPSLLGDGSTEPIVPDPSLLGDGSTEPIVPDPSLLGDGSTEPIVPDPSLLGDGSTESIVPNPSLLGDGSTEPIVPNPSLLDDGSTEPIVPNPSLLGDGSTEPIVPDPSLLDDGSTEPADADPSSVKGPTKAITAAPSSDWRVFYPRLLPVPVVHWRPLITRMLRGQDEDLQTLGWRLAKITLTAVDYNIMRRQYCNHSDMRNTRKISPEDNSKVVNSRKRPADLSVNQLRAMTEEEGNHLQQDKDQYEERCDGSQQNVACHSGVGTLTWNMDTLPQELMMSEPETSPTHDDVMDDQEVICPELEKAPLLKKLIKNRSKNKKRKLTTSRIGNSKRR